MTVPPPPAVPGELIEAAAAWLRSTHWDGNGCGTHGTNACSRCYGPSPADAREVAEDVLESVYGDIVEAARRDAECGAMPSPASHGDWPVCDRREGHAGRHTWERALEVLGGVNATAQIRRDGACDPAQSDEQPESAPAPVRDAEGPQIAAQSVEWGVRFASGAGDVTTGYDDEDDAKKSAAYWKDRGDPGTVMRRTVTVGAWEASQ